jgi:hypothetical protein
MNQPKFKFGDKVEHKENKDTFIVNAVIWHENKRFMYLVVPDSVIYQCHYDGGYWEDDLELYQEPKEKKLFAYTDDGEIRFFDKEYSALAIEINRSPEYDITYPLDSK